MESRVTSRWVTPAVYSVIRRLGRQASQQPQRDGVAMISICNQFPEGTVSHQVGLFPFGPIRAHVPTYSNICMIGVEEERDQKCK